MRRLVPAVLATVTSLGTVLAAGPTATAHDGILRGVRDVLRNVEIRVHSHEVRHHCTYERIWQPPVYRTVIVGRDHCGHPIYERCLVREGYWRTVRTCGCH